MRCKGGWQVIQRRKSGNELFNRTWLEYENGFGSPYRDHWIGLKWICLVTQSSPYQIQFEIQGGVVAIYNRFQIGVKCVVVFVRVLDENNYDGIPSFLSTVRPVAQ
eukprot:NODE_1142_length_486_cov_83.785515_g1132_i0.p1 GENE.NODE_1142_length_486_cov_83.785515_g1132_i0~~NODE_1142_length_486_cov_83.785515_g1132_i0.p1  ORF type:complete len:106 (+),score=12.63 NODE_1142_length_486_cov_83.785515_g1132_i0:112-429(+)